MEFQITILLVFFASCVLPTGVVIIHNHLREQERNRKSKSEGA